MDRIWLAGSFVSAEPDPRDVDVTYFIGLGRYDELSRADVADLVEFTEVAWCRAHGMRVDAYLVPLLDGTPYGRMTKGALSAAEEDSLRGIGLYDEVWQRPRRSLGSVPEGRRGYVEVLL
ncbi:hypothetical protein AB0J21_16950 [Streptomyces sp. NPDC049954]|uniref:DUF6932 family protein n=1 Tax=Streptomyces sp. NPDC049954 TaxID=3155779 RepID=UPI003440886A